MILLLATLALADDDKAITASLHGDVKTFFTASFPYDSPLLPDDPSGQGVFDQRLKLEAAWRGMTLELHHATTAITAGGAAVAGLGTNTGVGLQADEVVDLSWVATDADLVLRGRVDRFSVRGSAGGLDVRVGRQPISFGHAQMFTPLDLVNPFNPSFIDQEYKPGVDAVRIDTYRGLGDQLTLVAAYAGDWAIDGVILVGYAQTTRGVTDIGLFGGSVRGDAVIGTTLVTAIGPVGVQSDVTVTAPPGEDVFVRGTLGGFFRPAANTTISIEGYVQTLGGGNPDAYFAVTSSDRFARGELWLMGRGYLGVAASQQFLPELNGSIAAIANVGNPSVFIAPSLAWSVSGNANVAVGGFVGVGERPGELDLLDPGSVLNSEFGTYPGLVFTQVKAYF